MLRPLIPKNKNVCFISSGEIDLAVVHIEKLIKSGLSQEDIAVIAPYNLQVSINFIIKRMSNPIQISKS